MFKKLCWGILSLCILMLSGCEKSNKETTNAEQDTKQKIIVGATPEPHAIMLEQIKELLNKEGVILEIKEFTDYVTPNLSLNDGSLDANFFQHQPYLDSFNKEKGTKLISVGIVHLEPMGVYSNKIKSLEELKEGDLVSLPNDPSNGARALRILEAQGLITLKESVDLVSIQDIQSNPKNLQFKELDAPQLTRTLNDVAISIINTNFALLANLNPLNDAIALEDKNSPYANVLVVKEGRESDEAILKLMRALNSPTMKDFILNQYKGAILPSFQDCN